MPVTKTAKRALRGSKRKEAVNKIRMEKLEIAIRRANKISSAKAVQDAISLTDRAVKNKLIHRNKAARIKSQLSKLLPKARKSSKAKKKTS